MINHNILSPDGNRWSYNPNTKNWQLLESVIYTTSDDRKWNYKNGKWEELKPMIHDCCHCHSKSTIHKIGIKIFFVKCSHCKMKGPQKPSEMEAIKIWNNLIETNDLEE